MISKENHIVVTGGAGFIGSHVIDGLNKRGITAITIVDRILPTDPRMVYLKKLSFKHIVSPEVFLSSLENSKTQKPDVIIHLGARADTSEKDTAFLFHNNTLYTKTLFDYCVKEGVRFFYASSIATYGDGSRGFDDKEQMLKPLNPYGESKQKADELIQKNTQKPPQWVGLKFVNVYGPHESFKGRMATVVYHGYKQILQDGEMRLFKSYRDDYKDGEQKRDIVYVKDVVDVLFYFLDNPAVSGIFNVGTGEARTFLDIAHTIFSVLKKTPRVRFVDIPEDIRNTYQYYTCADISKLRSVGYTKKFFTLEEGVGDYINNYLSKEKDN